MDSPFSLCTIEDQWAIVCFLRAEGVKGVGIHTSLFFFNMGTLTECVCEQTSVTDSECSGHLSMATSDNKQNKPDQ